MMLEGAVFTLDLDPESRDAFMAEATEANRPASQLVRDFVRQRREIRGHDAWFRAQVEQGVREADDPTARRIPRDEVAIGWQRQRAELVELAAGRIG